MDKKFWAAAFTLSGTIIGAGILGLPYVFAKAGFFTGLFWLIILGLILLFTKLCLGEITLRTRGEHHLTGYAEKYLGKYGRKIMFFTVVFGVYSALLAYLIGEGQSLSKFFTGTIDYSLFFAIGFWLIMTLLLREGLRGLKKVETWGVLIIIVFVVVIFAYYFPQINIENISGFSESIGNFFFPFGVILFSLLGFTSIPELRKEIKGEEKKLKKAIIIGVLIPVVLYFIFSLTLVGVLGDNIAEVATVSFGKLIVLFGVFTIMTGFFSLSFALRDMFKMDLNISKKLNFILSSIIPLGLYLLVYFFKIAGFVKILGIGGVFSGGITGILILIINKKAKKKGNRKPEYKIPLSWIFIFLLSLIFIIGIISEIFI